MSEEITEEFMRRAIAQAANCKSEKSENRSPKVGAVIVKDGKVLAEAYRGEDPEKAGGHAEFLALAKLGNDAEGCTVYTTLEPCTARSPNKTPCADRLIKSGVSTIVIGMLDPNPVISGKGVARLRRSRKRVYLFPPNLMDLVEEQNEAFAQQFLGPTLPVLPKTEQFYCCRCKLPTEHAVLFEHQGNPRMEYSHQAFQTMSINQVFQCLGCKDASARRSELVLNADDEGQWEMVEDHRLPRQEVFGDMEAFIKEQFGEQRLLEEIRNSVNENGILLPILGLVEYLKSLLRVDGLLDLSKYQDRFSAEQMTAVNQVLEFPDTLARTGKAAMLSSLFATFGVVRAIKGILEPPTLQFESMVLQSNIQQKSAFEKAMAGVLTSGDG